MMIKISLHLTITCLIGAPIILFVAKLCGTAHGRIANKTNNLSAEASEIAEETIQIIRTVRSFGNEEEELKRFESTLQQSYKVSLIQAALSAVQRWFVDVRQKYHITLKFILKEYFRFFLVSTTLYEHRYVIIRC